MSSEFAQFLNQKFTDKEFQESIFDNMSVMIPCEENRSVVDVIDTLFTNTLSRETFNKALNTLSGGVRTGNCPRQIRVQASTCPMTVREPQQAATPALGVPVTATQMTATQAAIINQINRQRRNLAPLADPQQSRQPTQLTAPNAQIANRGSTSHPSPPMSPGKTLCLACGLVCLCILLLPVCWCIYCCCQCCISCIKLNEVFNQSSQIQPLQVQSTGQQGGTDEDKKCISDSFIDFIYKTDTDYKKNLVIEILTYIFELNGKDGKELFIDIEIEGKTYYEIFIAAQNAVKEISSQIYSKFKTMCNNNGTYSYGNGFAEIYKRFNKFLELKGDESKKTIMATSLANLSKLLGVSAGTMVEGRGGAKVSFSKMTVKELKHLAKERKLKGYSSLKKSELIALLKKRPTKKEKK